MERFRSTWFSRKPRTSFSQHCSLASRFQMNVVRAPRMIARPVGRVNWRALPFLSSFGEFPWFHSVGSTHFEDTVTKARGMHGNAAIMQRVVNHAENSLSVWFTYVVQNRTTDLVPKHGLVQHVSRAEPRTLILQSFGVVLFSVFSVVNGFTEIKKTPKVNGKSTLSDHGSIHRHRNVTKRSAIARFWNFNAPKTCKITAHLNLSNNFFFGERGRERVGEEMSQ